MKYLAFGDAPQPDKEAPTAPVRGPRELVALGKDLGIQEFIILLSQNETKPDFEADAMEGWLPERAGVRLKGRRRTLCGQRKATGKQTENPL